MVLPIIFSGNTRMDRSIRHASLRETGQDVTADHATSRPERNVTRKSSGHAWRSRNELRGTQPHSEY
jgi:hypothetical protein